MKHLRTVVHTACIALGIAAIPVAASAGGFAIAEQTVSGLGNAYAGGGAEANDASVVWYNPAGMTHLEGTEFQAGAHLIVPQFDYTDSGRTKQISPSSGATLNPTPLPTALKSDSGGLAAVVPNLYYSRNLTERVKFGLGVNSPFGLATKYSPNWIGRYHAVKSDILTINVNPALAVKATDRLSIGVGLSVQYIEADLTRAIDFDAGCVGAVAKGKLPAGAGGFLLTGCNTPGSGTAEGFVKFKADDTSLGFNLGLLYELSSDTRISVAYRSRIRHSLDGKADFSTPAATISTNATTDGTMRALFADDGITVPLVLPETISFSAYHNLGRVALLGDITWTGWSSVPALKIVYDKPTTALTGVSADPLFFRDAWRLSLGMNYEVNDRLLLRTGAAFDQSPIKSAERRIAGLPDNNRIWVSAGASYRFSDKLSADFAYSHQFLPDTRILHANSTGTQLDGKFDNQGNIFSAQVRLSF